MMISLPAAWAGLVERPVCIVSEAERPDGRSQEARRSML